MKVFAAIKRGAHAEPHVFRTSTERSDWLERQFHAASPDQLPEFLLLEGEYVAGPVKRWDVRKVQEQDIWPKA